MDGIRIAFLTLIAIPDDEFASKVPGVFFDPLGALGNLARKIATNGPSGEVVPVVPDDDPQLSSSSSSSKPGLIPPVKRKPKTKDQQKGREASSSKPKPFGVHDVENMGMRKINLNIADAVKELQQVEDYTTFLLGQGKNTRKMKEAAKEVIPTNKPLMPYFDISNDPYFIKKIIATLYDSPSLDRRAVDHNQFTLSVIRSDSNTSQYLK